MYDIYNKAEEILQNDESFVMVTILNKYGTVPRERGTKMIVKKDSSIIGTVGGGLSEALCVKLSKELIKDKYSIIKNFSNCDKNSGIACGGEIKVLMEYVDGNNEKTKNIYKIISKMTRDREDFVVITEIPEDEGTVKNINKWVCSETSLIGEENSRVKAVYKSIRENFKNSKFEILLADKGKYVIEPTMHYETVFIIGAGHVGQKLSEMTKMVDFRTIIIDDRAEFANRARFPRVDDVITINDYNDILESIRIDEDSYIVISTRGHLCDKEVLSKVLRTKAKYIGLLGSRKKKEFIYNILLNDGFNEEELQRVHCPIGLDISAQTPEEIAVSITAQLIKNRRSGHEEL